MSIEHVSGPVMRALISPAAVVTEKASWAARPRRRM
ncbi:hypothetical protein HRbin41_01449 [bacterium HR41]|nr:hypothetical protein HRbin41_01449 [bacterium HR41]